jgi:hypothetical protein
MRLRAAIETAHPAGLKPHCQGMARQNLPIGVIRRPQRLLTAPPPRRDPFPDSTHSVLRRHEFGLFLRIPIERFGMRVGRIGCRLRFPLVASFQNREPCRPSRRGANDTPCYHNFPDSTHENRSATKNPKNLFVRKNPREQTGIERDPGPRRELFAPRPRASTPAIPEKGREKHIAHLSRATGLVRGGTPIGRVSRGFQTGLMGRQC